MPRLVVVGSTNVDLTFRVPRLPRSGETLSASSLHTGHGGKGANQAVLAARLGAQVTMVSAVGDDAFGRQALDNYRRQGVDTQHVRVLLDQPDGQRRRSSSTTRPTTVSSSSPGPTPRSAPTTFKRLPRRSPRRTPC